MSLLIIGNTNTAYDEFISGYDLLQDAWVPAIVNDLWGNNAAHVSLDTFAVHQGIDVSVDIVSSYSIKFWLVQDISVPYGIHVSMELASVLFSIDVSVDYNSLYAIGAVVDDMRCVYSLRHSITTGTQAVYNLANYKDYSSVQVVQAILVEDDIEVVHTVLHFVSNDISTHYDIYQTNYLEFNGSFDLLITQPVNIDMLAVYTIYDPTSESIVTDGSLTVDGVTVNTDGMTISHDEDSYCWTLNATLSKIEDWIICEPGKLAVVIIGSDIYNFIIDSRDKDSSFDSDSFSLLGRSVSSVYGEGSLPIHKTWDVIDSFDVLDELIPTGILKNIINWQILADRLTSDGETAISIVKQIVEASGGILYSETEGSLVAEFKYKVPPSLYDINNVDHTVSDLDDITQITQSKESRPGYTQVEVSDEPDSNDTSISITEIEKDLVNYVSTLKIVVYPFVPTFNLLTSKLGVVIAPSLAPINEQLTEVIELVNGEGAVGEPILSLDSFTFLDTDLGLLKFKSNAITSEINGTTLVEITYTTQYHKVLVDVNSPVQAQVYSWED